MAGMGPPPKAAGTRSRRNATLPMTTLPAKGRPGKPPPWPLPKDPTLELRAAIAERRADRLHEQINETDDRRTLGRLERELDAALAEVDLVEREVKGRAAMETQLWCELWATPQAVMWEQYGWDRGVAVYARLQIRTELGDLEAAKEARQREDRLGLNPQALLRLRWEIERTDEAENKGRTRRSAQPRKAPSKKAAAARDPRSVLRAV